MDFGSDAEMLTGAEILLQLTRQNDEQRKTAEEKVGSYSELHKVLASLAEKTRHPILAPVANGLAYFEAELRHTNEVVVLLGDNWFAERSVSQASGICQRRLDFLRRELSRLDEERRQLEAKRIFFEQEVVHSSSLEGVAVPQATQAPQGNCSSSSSSSLPTTANSVPAEAENLFSDEDELTDAELLELEAELGPELLQDDALVEQRMWELMVAKRRVRLAVFGGSEDAVTSAEEPAALSLSARLVSEDKSGGGSAPKYRDPGEIGHESQRATPPCGATTDAASLPSKKVTFAEPSVAVRDSVPAAAVSVAKTDVVPPSSLRGGGPLRDVVERQPQHGSTSLTAPHEVVGVASGGQQAPSDRQDPPARVPKRSLFMQRMLGEEGQ